MERWQAVSHEIWLAITWSPSRPACRHVSRRHARHDHIVRGYSHLRSNGRRRIRSRADLRCDLFATLFSFGGTVLGGIWRPSWGRFRGWDPKENGAVLIVLWCAIILHARWGGFIRPRGLMIMAIFGNIVTSFSWFGVNMLGVGLHSYGFMQKAFPWLVGFIVSQLALMVVAAMPLERWRSFRTSPRAASKRSPQGMKFYPQTAVETMSE